MPGELRAGDVLPDPHFSGRPGRVLEVAPTWYGASIRYEYDGKTCVSAVFDHDVSSPPAERPIQAGIEVER
jgi:hypothetical protein